MLLGVAPLGCSGDPDGPFTDTSTTGNNTNHPNDGDPLAPGDAPPTWAVESGDAVFFVGNSFLGGEDDRLADLVTALGAGMEPGVVIHTGSHVVYGNQPLSWFFQQPESQNAIASGEYDVFVVQGEEREPVDHEEEFKQAVRDYHAAVTANGGTLMLFMTWDFIWERETTFFADLSAAYDEIGQELGVPVIPVGLIYDDCNQHPYGDEEPYWLTSQDLHQNQMGTAVNTYATFAMLTGRNPEGRAYVPPYANPLPDDLARYLSDASWARVEPRLR